MSKKCQNYKNSKNCECKRCIYCMKRIRQNMLVNNEDTLPHTNLKSKQRWPDNQIKSMADAELRKLLMDIRAELNSRGALERVPSHLKYGKVCKKKKIIRKKMENNNE